MSPFRRIEAADPKVPLVLSCEHASNELPAPWRWPDADARLVDDHWAWDPGAAALTTALAARLGVPAVLAGFTRLLVDPNRPLDSETLFRTHADGEPVRINAAIDDAERERRISGWYQPYHQAFDDMVVAHPGFDVLSLHSFTPVYEGDVREVQLGVLWDADVALGETFLRHLADTHDGVRANEPYSGRNGLMYSPQHHATQRGRRAVELEVRNDLLATADGVARVATVVEQVIRAVWG